MQVRGKDGCTITLVRKSGIVGIGMAKARNATPWEDCHERLTSRRLANGGESLGNNPA